MSKNTTNEFIIAYYDSFEDYNAILSTSCKTWNNVAKNQLRKKIKTLEGVWEDNNSKSLEVSFQNGSKAYFLYIQPTINVFDLHTEIRETFSDGIKEHEKISFNILNLSKKHQEISITALTSLIHLTKWDYPKYGKKAKKEKKSKKDFGFYASIETGDFYLKGLAIADGTNLVRTLATTPANYMISKHLVKIAKAYGKKLRGVSVDYINENKLKELKAGCFLSVIQGTKGSDGGIVHLSYRTRFQNTKTIAIVGKGVTFDTGGYTLKTEGYMNDMHRDMTGAAVSLALFKALVETKVKANIDLYLAIGENLVSETAYKPNDVVIAMDGTSVEVLDTDAEGRMLLADTILYANKQKPDLMVDFATLTGGMIGALDHRLSGVFSNNDKLLKKAVEAGVFSGERMWGFPTPDDYKRELNSDIADITQCNSENDEADHIYAACFLKHFAGKTPWVHVDLSSEECEDGLGLVDTDVTGFGVRWGFEFINSYLMEK